MRVLSGTAVLGPAGLNRTPLHYTGIRWALCGRSDGTSESEAHIARHGVTPEEVEQAVNSRPRYEAPGREDSTLLYLRH